MSGSKAQQPNTSPIRWGFAFGFSHAFHVALDNLEAET
jgi:hypothetical protein